MLPMGDAASGLPSPDQVRQLQAQVNRFGTSAPVGLRVVPTAIPVTGALDAATAEAAVAILEVRLMQSFAQFPSASDPNKAVLAQLEAADPVSYVITNFSTVLSTVQQYGDALKLAAATPIFITQAVDALGDPTNLAVLGGAALLFYYLGSK